MKFDQNAFEQAMPIVELWDFSLAVEKLMEIDATKWSNEKCQAAVRDYKRYMAVTKALNGVQLVPNADIDEIWHMHILDTRAYMKDCHDLFGEYLHHYPYFGMLSAENKQQWLDVQGYSSELWFSLFGETLYKDINRPQKCPQVCPCHVDNIMLTEGVGVPDMEKTA